MEEVEKTYGTSRYDDDPAAHKTIRTSKRAYFIDIKADENDDVFIAVTESKKCFNDDGSFYYERHKIFLYKEDFIKFSDGLTSMMDLVNSGDLDANLTTHKENAPQGVPVTKKKPVFIKKRPKADSSIGEASVSVHSENSYDSLELEDISTIH